MPPEEALIWADENESPQSLLGAWRGMAGLSSSPRDSHSVSITAFLLSSRALCTLHVHLVHTKLQLPSPGHRVSNLLLC